MHQQLFAKYARFSSQLREWCIGCSFASLVRDAFQFCERVFFCFSEELNRSCFWAAAAEATAVQPASYCMKISHFRIYFLNEMNRVCPLPAVDLKIVFFARDARVCTSDLRTNVWVAIRNEISLENMMYSFRSAKEKKKKNVCKTTQINIIGLQSQWITWSCARTADAAVAGCWHYAQRAHLFSLLRRTPNTMAICEFSFAIFILQLRNGIPSMGFSSTTTPAALNVLLTHIRRPMQKTQK